MCKENHNFEQEFLEDDSGLISGNITDEEIKEIDFVGKESLYNSDGELKQDNDTFELKYRLERA